MFVALMIAAALTTQDLKIPRTPENIAFETRFKGEMRAKMTPAQRKAAEAKYAAIRKQFEEGRKNIKGIVKGTHVVKPEKVVEQRALLRAMAQNMETIGRGWDAPASFRRFVKSFVHDCEEAAKFLEKTK